jgi:hypothetical protein
MVLFIRGVESLLFGKTYGYWIDKHKATHASSLIGLVVVFELSEVIDAG